MRVIITDHAIERFIQRVSPESSAEEARSELASLFNTSSKTGKTRWGTQTRVSGYRPGVILIIKEENVIITILTRKELDENDASEFEFLECENAEQKKLLTDKLQNLRKELIKLDQERNEINCRKSQLLNQLAELDVDWNETGKKRSQLFTTITHLQRQIQSYE